MLWTWTLYNLELLQFLLLANTGNVQHKRQGQKPQESNLSTTRQAPSRPTRRKEHPATPRPTHILQPAPVRPVQGHGSLPTPQGPALLPSPAVRLPTNAQGQALPHSSAMGLPTNTPQGILPSPSVRPVLSTSTPHGQLPLRPPSVRASVPTYHSPPLGHHPFPYTAVPQYYYSAGPMMPPNFPATHPGPPASPNYPTSSAPLVFSQPARIPSSHPNSQPHVLHSNSYPSDQRNVIPSSSTQHASIFPHTAGRSPPYRQTISSPHQPKDTATLPIPMGGLSTSSHTTGLQQPYYVGNNMMSYPHSHPGQLPHNRQVIVPVPAKQNQPWDGMQNRWKNPSRNTNRQHKGKTS